MDFAQARDDLYEWECQQRLLAREQRHLRFVHEDRLLPPSPPPIVHFSEHEAAMLAERLKGEDGQRWEVVKYKYFVTVLKYMFLVSVLYSTTYFPDHFLLLLLSFPKQAGSFSLNVCLVA